MTLSISGSWEIKTEREEGEYVVSTESPSVKKKKKRTVEITCTYRFIIMNNYP